MIFKKYTIIRRTSYKRGIMEIYKGSMKIKLSDTSISLFEEEEEIYYKELSSNSNLDFNYIKERTQKEKQQ